MTRRIRLQPRPRTAPTHARWYGMVVISPASVLGDTVPGPGFPSASGYLGSGPLGGVIGGFLGGEPRTGGAPGGPAGAAVPALESARAGGDMRRRVLAL